MQSILANIFCIGLLRLSAGAYAAAASTTVVTHSKWFRRTSVPFGNVRKAFFPCLRGKKIAIVL